MHSNHFGFNYCLHHKHDNGFEMRSDPSNQVTNAHIRILCLLLPFMKMGQRLENSKSLFLKEN